jgi:transcriptional regulator with XRE-family HTH domain
MPLNYEIIPSLIKRAGYRSNAEAARRAEMTPQRLSEICHGRRVDGIELRAVEKLAEALGVGVDSLLSRSDPRSPRR